MFFDLKDLSLSSSYSFDTNIEADGVTFASKLNLTPQKITITIMGEQNPNRTSPFKWENLDRVICRDLNKTFVVNGLIFRSGRSKNLTRTPAPISYFEYTYEVSHVIFSQEELEQDHRFHAIFIHSETVSEWIGNTETQENIIIEYHNGEHVFYSKQDKLIEFVVNLDDYGKIGVKYNPIIEHSSPTYKSGIFFPPSMFVSFKIPPDSISLKKEYDKIYSFLGVITGDEVAIDKIVVEYLHNGVSKLASLYYPSQKVPIRDKNTCVLFPLGRNLRFRTIHTPPMPMEIFKNYYSLGSLELGYWEKYQKYRRMENVEERYLGFFRILEALCFKQKNYLDSDLLQEYIEETKPSMIEFFDDSKSVTSFLKRLSQFNGSKYNTEKCIHDFFVSIPDNVTSLWKFGKKDIAELCTLRNDITHANDYYAEEYDIHVKAKFIEVLLILALFSKVDVELEISTQIIHRLNGYLAIQKKHNMSIKPTT